VVGKANYQNKDKKFGSSSNKEIHATIHYTEYTPIGAIYAQAL